MCDCTCAWFVSCSMSISPFRMCRCPAVIRKGVHDSYCQEAGKCLRDVLHVASHAELLPKAFNLSQLTGAAAATKPAGPARSSSPSGRSCNTAAVMAAATVPLEDEEDAEQDVDRLMAWMMRTLHP